MAVEFAIEVEQLNKTFSGSAFQSRKVVLHHLQFQVRSQRTTGFVGVNGSGKTTTLKCLLGFLFPDSGKTKIFGQNSTDPQSRQRVGYLPERPYLYEYLTAEEFLRFHWDLTGGGPGFDSISDQVLAKVNLSRAKKERIRGFSKGMMQRVGFAQALLRSPDLLILDEPMSGLDPDGRYLIKEMIREQRQQGRTLFFSTHYLSDVEELCDDIVVIDQGQILYSGPTVQLLKNSSPQVRVTWVPPDLTTPQEAVAKISDLAGEMMRIQKSGGQILAVNHQHVALEVAFKALRGDKDSGS